MVHLTKRVPGVIISLNGRTEVPLHGLAGVLTEAKTSVMHKAQPVRRGGMPAPGSLKEPFSGETVILRGILPEEMHLAEPEHPVSVKRQRSFPFCLSLQVPLLGLHGAALHALSVVIQSGSRALSVGNALLRGLKVPFRGQRKAALHSLPPAVHLSEHVLRPGIPLICRLSVP